MVSLKLFFAILARNTLKSQSYQSSIQCLALISPPAKRHLNGVSLVGHWWPVNSGIWILPPLIKLKTKNKKPVKVGPPLTQLPGPRMFIQLPNDEHNYTFFIHQYDVCISKNSCTYQPSNQAIKVAIKIQGCEQGRRRYIYKKKRTPLTPTKNTRDLDTFCFSNYYLKRKSRLRECRLVRKKSAWTTGKMCQWFACHLWGFHNAQGISWTNAENCTAAPPPQNSWHLRSRTALSLPSISKKP